jgi:hypothetical protein
MQQIFCRSLFLSACCLFFVVVLTASCSSKKTEADQPKKEKVYYPYAPRLDVDFSGGDDTKAKIVLNIWRSIAGGDLSTSATYFADSLTMVFPGKRISGGKDSILQIFQTQRAGLSTLQPHIDYWKPVFNKEKNEDWVLIWLNQEGTKPDKTLDSYAVHQVWKFDVAGKIYQVMEYRSQWEW